MAAMIDNVFSMVSEAMFCENLGRKAPLGKPYFSELEQLEETYAFAMDMDIRRLIEAVCGATVYPLLVVGSGGSLTVARLIAALHQQFARMVAKPITPLDLYENNEVLMNAAIWFISAGGRNTDIQAAVRTAIAGEPRHMLIACAKTGSPIATFAGKYNYTDFFEFELPSQRDGFLATNSLLAFSVLFVRAYLNMFGNERKLPPHLPSLMGFDKSWNCSLDRLRERCRPLWDRENLVVLYGNGTEAAAYDLESKFTEAALGSVQISDFRNFAHGRHHWLAKRGASSAVVSLATSKERTLAEKTLGLLPQGIPIVEFDFPCRGFTSSIQAIVTVLHIVGLAGETRGIDPGRPSVPLFGRQIYNLRLTSHIEPHLHCNVNEVTTAERRKLNVTQVPYYDQEQFSIWRQAYQSFLEQFKGMLFSGVVFDYDGTLCDRRKRFSELDAEVAKQLLRLLATGLMIGIATGRGKSVKTVLRKAIPSSYWGRILVGYYNGGDCALLTDDEHPDGTNTACSELTLISDALKADPRLQRLFDLSVRRTQIAVESISWTPVPVLWALANEVVRKHGLPGVTAVTSGHSVDILAPGITKRSLVRKILTNHCLSPDARILCIGDKGLWPGNDFDLLNEPFSLSVDEVSSDPATCWNLAPAGYRGIQATLYYLRHMLATEDGLVVKLPTSKKASS